MNGHLTADTTVLSYEVAKMQSGSNHWSSSENNRNNGRNVNFSNGNTNNNNKYNSNVVRPVAAFLDYPPNDFISSVWEAYNDCLCGKMRSDGAIEYMQIAATDIPCLAYELWVRTYQPGTSTCFLVRYPKWREVFAAGFRDRIVHHWICLRLNPLFEERFISQGDVSFNCRKGLGTDKAVEHVANIMDKISDHYHRPAWVFKGDLVGFFMSIDKDLLWEKLYGFTLRWRRIQEKEGWKRIYDKGIVGMMPNMYWDILIRTTKTIVMHHPEKDCILNTKPHLWKNMDTNKSLFTSPTGEPIGNLTTQLFANFLMSFFVEYIQNLYRGRNWGMAQFVDDFTIVCDDLDFLTASIPQIESFLKQELCQTMHHDKRYLQPVSHGVLFVGTFIKPGRFYLSNRTLARMKEKCTGFGKALSDGQMSAYDLLHIEQVINSYLGFCRRRKTYKFRREFLALLGLSFWNYFYIKGHYDSIRTKKKYQPINN